MYKIYKISDNTSDDVYIGLTKTRLCQRLATHKYTKACMAYKIIERGNFNVEVIEETDDKTRERYWIENTENTINKNIPCRTKEEIILRNRKNSKENYYKNPKYFQQYQKEYQKNYLRKRPTYQTQYQKKYRENNENKKKAKKYREEYYKANKEVLNTLRKNKYYFSKSCDGLNLIDPSIFT